eukprot:gene9678-20123_t
MKLIGILFLVVSENTSNGKNATSKILKINAIHEEELLNLRHIINQKISSESKKCHYYPAHAHEEFFSNKWEKVTSSFKAGPVFVYSPCMSAYNLGNSLGNYLNELACAISANVYIIVATKIWDYPFMPFEFKGNGRSHTKESSKQHRTTGIGPHTQQLDKHLLTFFEILPNVYGPTLTIHPKAKNESLSASQALETFCSCERYCWTDAKAPWIQNADMIGELMNMALDAHLAANESQIEKGTIIHHGEDADLSSAPPDTFLPIVPDVAIQYRCGDTVPSVIYGFLPFPTIASLIPEDSKYIYVLTDHPSRAHLLGGEKPFAHKCPGILSSLFIYLQKRFTNATVIVKRGGDPFLDYARLARARVTICSASTFCIWPALASRGDAYFPVTPLVASWTPQTNHTPYLGPHFHWLHYPRIVTEFKVNTPLETIIEVLMEVIPRTAIK